LKQESIPAGVEQAPVLYSENPLAALPEHNTFNEPMDEKEVTDYETLKISGLKLFESPAESANNFVPYKSKTSKRYSQQILGRWSFALYYGQQYETVGSAETNRETHKDALSNFMQSAGAQQSGNAISFTLSYRLLHRLQIRSGLTYSETQSQSQFTYQYTDLPVWQNGKIIGYFHRPLQPEYDYKEQVNNRNTIVQMPLELSALAYSGRKWSFWFNTGLQIPLLQKTRYSVFSFQNEELQNTAQASFKPLQVSAGIRVQYTLMAGLSLASEYKIQNKHMQLENDQIVYSARIKSSAFSLGLIFTPKLRKK
jgi:hypothetical protein